MALEKLQDLLVDPGYISEDDFKLASKNVGGKSELIIDQLIDRGLIKDTEVGQLLAEEINVSFIDLSKQKIDEQVLSLIPERVARTNGVIAFEEGEMFVKVGMLNPSDLETQQMLEKKFGKSIQVYLVSKKQFKQALSSYQASLKKVFADIFSKLKDENLDIEIRDETVISMVDNLLKFGYQQKASDIHIEPYVDKIVIRFRIDGVMHTVLEIPKDLGDSVLTRIKILAKMRTDEHRAAQDGKLRFNDDNFTVDVRVSIVPVTEGENIVMRLLSDRSRRFSLEDLGLSESNFSKVRSAIKSPHGMILVTGPTGSGKTTSLYAILKILNKKEVHISTIEDPVEYDLEGISQIQVNSKTDLTFAKGLRAIVRQDPDIIMVGEIRDEETAGIAVNSALTGHLVLSTLHTNDAATALPRLLDMGVEPFLVVSTVNIIVAQRLVRKLCENCRVSYKPTEQEITALNTELKGVSKGHNLNIELGIRLYKANGCKICAFTKYIGRVGVFEVLEVTEEIKGLVLNRSSTGAIIAKAREQGMITMLEDGIYKIKQGVTTIEEVLRVTKE